MRERERVGVPLSQEGGGAQHERRRGESRAGEGKEGESVEISSIANVLAGNQEERLKRIISLSLYIL